MHENYIMRLGNEDEARAMRWLMKSAEEDNDRPILSGIKVDGERVVTSDGFSMFISPTPEVFRQYDGQVIKPVSEPGNPDSKAKVIPVRPTNLNYCSIEGTFPDYEQMIPTAPPKYRIGISRETLGKLVDMPSDSNRIVFDFTFPTSPILATTCYEEQNYTAVIMPMTIDDEDFNAHFPNLKPVEEPTDLNTANLVTMVERLKEDKQDRDNDIASLEKLLGEYREVMDQQAEELSNLRHPVNQIPEPDTIDVTDEFSDILKPPQDEVEEDLSHLLDDLIGDGDELSALLDVADPYDEEESAAEYEDYHSTQVDTDVEVKETPRQRHTFSKKVDKKSTERKPIKPLDLSGLIGG